MGSPLLPKWAASPSDQNLWLNMDADSGGPVAANTTTDTFTITGGTSITTSISGDAVTITNDAPNVDQNLWLTVSGDSGSTAANLTNDTLTIAGGVGVVTAMSGDTLTITAAVDELAEKSGALVGTDRLTGTSGTTNFSETINTIPLSIFSNDSAFAPDQNIWLNMDADSGGPVAANTTSDTFTITGGTSITTSISGDAVTIVNDAPNVDQNLWLNIGADSGGPVAANTTSDTLTLTGGDGVDTTISGDAVTFDVDATVARMSAGSPVLTNVGTIRVDEVDLGVIGTFTTSTLTTTSVSQVAVASFAIAKYRSAEYTVQAVQGNNFHTTKLLAVHDGTDACSTEFGTITLPSFYGSPAAGSPAISGEQATYDVDINAGSLRLLATPTTTSSTVFKVTAQLTTL